MLECPVCQGEVPEVLGAPEQRCPHCRARLTRGDAGTIIPGPATEQPPSTRADAAGALRAGFGTWLANFGAFTAFWLVPSLVTAGTTLLGYALGLPDALATGSWRFFAIAIPLGWIDLTVSLLYVAGIAGMVAEARTRGYASLTGGYQTLSAQGDRLLQVATLITGLLLLCVALILAPMLAFTSLDLSPGMSFLLLFLLVFADIPAILFILWYLFVLPIAALHPEWPLRQVFRESRAFARRNRTVGFTAALMVLLFAAVIVSFIAVRLLAWGLRFTGTPDAPPALLEATEALLASLLVSAIPVLIATYYLRAGSEAHEIEAAELRGAPEEEPEPETPRERVVRCPGCRTPIHYERTGAPVRLTCPTCGRQGVVR